MANGEPINFPSTPAGALKSPQYKVGDYLAAHDLEIRQQYLLQRLRRHNRFLHGYGVVCGLRVVPARDPKRPWALFVCPGYAIGPHAHEIEVLAATMVDIRDYLWRQPIPHNHPQQNAYIGIRYAEDLVRPVPSIPVGCHCDETVYKPSRIRDGFQVDVLWEFLESNDDGEEFHICGQASAPCPACPDSPYLVLAHVTLPPGENFHFTTDRIDNSVRRQLYNTAMLQEQLIACCCKDQPPPPPSADLEIIKKEMSRGIDQEGFLKVIYKIVVINHGPGVAHTVSVKDSVTVTNGGRVVGASDFPANPGNEITTEKIPPTETAEFETEIPTLPALQNAIIDFAIQFRVGRQFTITNSATVSSATQDPYPDNNLARVPPL